MKKALLSIVAICFFVAGSTNVFAQKAKFKTSTVKVQKTRLPIHYVDPDKRTYDLYAKGSYASEIDVHEKKIYGWTPDQDSPMLKGVVSLYGFTINSPSLKTEKKTKKDKDGNVTDTWNEYHYVNTATGNGTLYVYGVDNPFNYKAKNKDKKKSKFQEKQEAKAAEEKKSLAANPFLSDDDVKEAAESDIGSDEGLSGEELPLLTTYKVDQTTEVKSGTFRSSGKAYTDYKNKRSKLSGFRGTYPNSAYRSAVNKLNAMYGYSPVRESFSIRTMKSDKHGEFKTWNDAAQAATMLFKTVKYNKSIDETSTKFDPIIKYFNDQLTKSADDKKAKKLAKAAFKNLTNIMYYLDRHDDMIKIAQGYSENKNLDGYAKRMVDKSMRMKAHLLFHKMDTAHMESGEDIAEEDMEVSEAEDDDDEEGN